MSDVFYYFGLLASLKWLLLASFRFYQGEWWTSSVNACFGLIIFGLWTYLKERPR